MRFGLIAYPQKPLIIAPSGVSRGTRCLKVVRNLLQLAYPDYAEKKVTKKVIFSHEKIVDSTLELSAKVLHCKYQ